MVAPWRRRGIFLTASVFSSETSLRPPMYRPITINVFLAASVFQTLLVKNAEVTLDLGLGKVISAQLPAALPAKTDSWFFAHAAIASR
jgi:hypothetical protein